MADTSQVKEITARLEQGVKDLFASDGYADYLKTMSRFHSYSTRNTLLIHMQMPSATLVAGFGAWQKKFERHVLRGAKSIKILAPTPFTIREEKEKLDPETRLPVLDEQGMPIVEQIERQFARFKVVSVFDVSQTDGKPIPSLAQDLTGNVEQYTAFMDALREVSPLPIVFERMPEDTDGTCHFGNRIAIREGMSEIQTVSAVIHEMTHARLHDISLTVSGDNTPAPKDRRTEEVEAESVSYAVCQYFGIETGANSFGYLASWSAGRELKELNASLDTIRKTAAEMIDAIDGRFQEIVKERGIVFAVGEEQVSLYEGEAEYMDAPEAAVLAVQPVAIPVPAAVSPIADTPTPANPQVAETRRPGETVLMPLVFEDGNLNRAGKRTRVKIEPPIGRYAMYSRNVGGMDYMYMLTASAMLVQLGEAFRFKDVTEQQIAAHIKMSVEAFEKQLGNPDTWADYSAAAIANRIAEAEAHNGPIREEREAGYAREAQARRERQEAVQREREEIFSATVRDIESKILSGEKTDVELDHYKDKNPLFALFDKYGIDVPLATKGWVNRNLKAFQINAGGSVTMWLPQKVKASEAFHHAIIELKNALEADRTSQRSVEAVIGEEQPKPERDEAGQLAADYGQCVLDAYRHGKLRGSQQEFDKDIAGIADSIRAGNIGGIREALGRIVHAPVTAGSPVAAQAASLIERLDKISPPTQTAVQDAPEQDANPLPTAAPDMSLPDPALSEADRDAYGYTDSGMLPLSGERAAELFDSDHAVYLLYPDNTEAMAFDRDEILSHGGICGIEREDWERSPMRVAQMSAAANSEGVRESELLHGGDSFGIYQIKGGDEMREYIFEAFSRLKDLGLSVARGNYELVYTMPISDVFAPAADRHDLLDQIYATFNASHPKDYTGRSVSISDVIVLNYGGEVSSHYVDRFSFRELPSFTGAETPRDSEAPAQESYSQVGNTPAASPQSGPTVSELEADASAGKPISIMDLSRAVNAERKNDPRIIISGLQPARAMKRSPTLAEQLAEGKRMAAAQGQNTAQKSNNREV